MDSREVIEDDEDYYEFDEYCECLIEDTYADSFVMEANEQK